MRHISLPVAMTPEQLADFIRSNRVETQNHIEKFPLTEDEKNELARKSANAFAQITRLKNLLKEVSTLIKKGTPWNSSLGDDGDNVPVPFTIPPTAGITVLEANMLHANDQLNKGFREDLTAIYILPWPEYEKMVGVDIEGNEWSAYSREMNSVEIRQHGKPVLAASVSNEIRDIMEDQGIEIEQVKGKEVKLVQKEKKKKDSAISKQPELSDAEKEELTGDEQQERPERGDINLL